MKNPITVIITIVVVAILGVSAYTLVQNSSRSDVMMKSDEAMMKKDDAAMEGEMMVADQMVSSRYIQFSMSVLESAASTRRVLFFYASWCPTCKPADASFTNNASKIPEDLTLIRVNYNDPETDQEEKELAKKYGVTYQHTFVQIDNAGKVVTNWNGGQIDELLAKVK